MTYPRGLFSLGIRRLRRRPANLLAGTLLAAIVGLSLVTPLLPFDRPERTQTWLAYAAPGAHVGESFWGRGWHPEPERDLLPWDHGMEQLRGWIFADRYLPPLMGRDALGRCLLARIFWGARISLVTGLVAGFFSLLIGVTYGAVSGYVGGRLDNVLMRFLDMLYAIPFIFVVIFFITMLRAWEEPSGGRSVSNLWVFFLVISLVYWLTMARVVRGQVVSLRELEFIEGARALGASRMRILARHIFPNIASVVIVYLTLTIPRVMLFEAFLSILGLGVEPPDISWGLLAREAFEVLNPVGRAWWLVLWPSVFLFATLSSLNHLGDALRDSFDPKTVR